MLPIGDTPNPRNFTPWVNYALIAANVAVFALVSLPLGAQRPDPTDPLLQAYARLLAESGFDVRQTLATLSAYDLFVFEHGFKAGAPEASDLFASMFLHGGIAHLAGNMLFLWIYGDNVEHRLGRVLYLLVYLATGVAATLSFAAFSGGAMTPLVGASGAISGVLGLYFLLFPRNRVKVFVFLFPILVDVILVPAWLVLGLYVIVDNFFPILLGAGGGVAYGAHLGGFFAGLLAAFVGERRGWSLRGGRARPASPGPRGPRPREPLTEQDLARRHLEHGLRLLRSGQAPAAWQHFARVLELNPDPDTRSRAIAALQAIEAHPKLRGW